MLFTLFSPVELVDFVKVSTLKKKFFFNKAETQIKHFIEVDLDRKTLESQSRLRYLIKD